MGSKTRSKRGATPFDVSQLLIKMEHRVNYSLLKMDSFTLEIVEFLRNCQNSVSQIESYDESSRVTLMARVVPFISQKK
jgi:hypothetical protein